MGARTHSALVRKYAPLMYYCIITAVDAVPSTPH